MNNPIGIFILVVIVWFGLIRLAISRLFPDKCDREEKRKSPIEPKHKDLFNLNQ